MRRRERGSRRESEEESATEGKREQGRKVRQPSGRDTCGAQRSINVSVCCLLLRGASKPGARGGPEEPCHADLTAHESPGRRSA